MALGLIDFDLISGMMENTRGRPDTIPSIDVTDFQLPVKREKRRMKERDSNNYSLVNLALL